MSPRILLTMNRLKSSPMQISYCCRRLKTLLMIQPQALNNPKFLWAPTHPHSLVLLPPLNPSVSQKFFDTLRSDLISRLPNGSPSNKPSKTLQISMPFPLVRSNIFRALFIDFTYLKERHSIQKSANNIYPLPRRHISRKPWTLCLRLGYASQLRPRTLSVCRRSLWRRKPTVPVD